MRLRGSDAALGGTGMERTLRASPSRICAAATLALALAALPVSAAPPDDLPPVGESAATTEMGDSLLTPSALFEVLNAYAQRRTSARALFSADFDSAAQARRQWEEPFDAELTGPQPPDGVPLNVAVLEPRRGQSAGLVSRSISLFGVRAAELRLAAMPRDAVGALLVEYLAEDGVWRLLDCIEAVPGEAPDFARRLRLLPEDALHPAFRFRVRVSPESGGAWYVDEIAIAERVDARFCRLTVAGASAEQFAFDLFTDEPDVAPREMAPMTRALPAGSRVYLVAPPALPDAGFDHWSFDSRRPDEAGRAVLLEVGDDVSVTAHFRPDRVGDGVFDVSVESEPRTVTLSTGLDTAARFARQSTPFRAAFRVGELLSLSAPLRTEELAFEGWMVDGQFAGADTELELRIEQDTSIVARYVRIGDMNADARVDKFDVDLFVLAIADADAYDARYPDLDRVLRGDVNGDGLFDEADIERFIDLVVEE